MTPHTAAIGAPTAAEACAVRPVAVLDAARRTTACPGRDLVIASDPEFRLGLATVGAITGDPVAFASTHALVVFKPDSLITGQALRLLALLTEGGFTPTAFRTGNISSLTQRALWRRQFGYSSPERIALTERYFALGPSVVALFRATTNGDTLPASVRLTELKGSTHPERRGPHHWRSVLTPVNRLLNLFHAADEPADVLREAAVLSGGGARLADLVRDSTARAAAGPSPARALEAQLRAFEERFNAAVPAASEPACAATRHLRDCQAPSFTDLVTVVRHDHGGEFCLECFDTSLDALCAPPSEWARLAVAGDEIPAFDPAMRELADTRKASADDWRARALS
ncbi:hypothetical protein [Streptomyces sp. R44]|uniref:Nucleoside diphosphate kinase n=1 Tax=Streptomyces sp. R44 TaxID=3238633 RepID=A0AB39TBW8_9ACTN